MGKKAIQRQSLTEQIKSILIERIIDGTLSPGDRLKELQIAEEFGTSQAPVREAIRSLQALGYVEHIPHVGALIKTFSQKEIEEAHQIREAMEGHCLIVASVDKDNLVAELTTHLDNMKRAVAENDIQAFTLADNLFHKSIVQASGNKSMLDIWESLRIQFQVVATLLETAMPLTKLYELHPPIIAAIKHQKREDAGRFLAEHYKQIALYWSKEQDE